MLETWKKSVIHLECATDSVYFSDRIKKIREMQERLESGELTRDNFEKELTKGSRDLRHHGTALFIIHNNKRYLLTAKHVVFDEVVSKREFQEDVKRASSYKDNMQPPLIQSAIERSSNKIFNIIFRVPSLDEVIKYPNSDPKEFLMNLSAGTTDSVPYTFLEPEYDLAIISLDQRNSNFGDQLIKLGYKPISLDSIGNEPTSEGCEVFTVGFPGSTSVIGEISQHPASAHWSSSYYSLPVFSFGRVAMLCKHLPFYWVDMSIYPGNSGGPIIENEKLVGVVSRQALIPIDSVPDVETRIPFGKIIKAKYIHKLLRTQEQKDAR